jgi:predicted nucleic acid-binding protein
MMAQRVYIETTIPSYLTAWPSRSVVRAAHQQLTRQWWETRREDFDLVVSQLVLDECAAGDADAAEKRLELLRGIPVLAVTEPVGPLAATIIRDLNLPPKAVNDGVHVALAAAHGVEYLLTWNCTHIANAAYRERIAAACVAAGFRAPVVATPEELLKEDIDVG